MKKKRSSTRRFFTMKKITKIIITLALLCAMLTLPAMAREVSFSDENTDALITLLNNNAARMNGDLADFIKVQAGPGSDAIIAAQKVLVANKIAQINKECAQNHIQMLEGKVYNAKQLEATRLTQLNNFKTLYAGSPSFIGELNIAQKEYDNCVAKRTAAEAYLATARIKLAPYLGK